MSKVVINSLLSTSGISITEPESAETSAIAFTSPASPFILAYPWSATTGFGTKYTNPSTLPGNDGNDVGFSSDGNAIAIGTAASPFVSIYSWSNASGFGTKYNNPSPAIPFTAIEKVYFSPASDAITLSAGFAAESTQSYEWSSATGFGTKYSAPVSQPNYNLGMAFSPAGSTVAITHPSSPFISAYPWSVVGGFGTKYANPSSLPVAQTNEVAFSPAGDVIVLANNGTTPRITAYAWSDITGFGTKYTNPSVLPTGAGNSVAFSPSGDAVAVAHTTSPFITVYPWSTATGFGTKYANPAVLPIGTGRSVSFSSAGDSLAITHDTTPFITAYPWSAATGFGTKYANPSTLPSSAGSRVSFAPITRRVISFVTSASTPGVTTITVPTTSVVGDIAFVVSGSVSGTNPAIPEGWTLLSQTVGGLFTFRVMYKILTISDIGATITVANSGNAAAYAANSVLVFRSSTPVVSIDITSSNFDGEVSSLPTRTKNTATYPSPNLIIASRYSFNKLYSNLTQAFQETYWNRGIFVNSSINGLAIGFEIQNILNIDRTITPAVPFASYEHLHSFVVNFN